ncbi:MAG: mechanosensitive ion channel [Oscillospiraceae bacterium]|nr:mechanosensitive ion channel [Oscillospiraceae bacterium]
MSIPTMEELTELSESVPTTDQIQDYLGNMLNNLFPAIITLVFCVLVSKVILSFSDRLMRRMSAEPTLGKFIRAVLRVILWLLTAIMVADKLGIPTSSMVALLSVTGLAVSLALQNTLSNLAGGILLLVTKPFMVGDYISAGGVEGTVLEVGLVYTKVNTVDNKRISIPNSDISGAKIINCSTEGRRRVDLVISASYDAPVETVKNALREIIAGHPLVLPDPEPFVRLSAYQDSSIAYTVRVWTNNSDYWTVYFDMLEQVKTTFDKYGIELTYNHLNVHLMDK